MMQVQAAPVIASGVQVRAPPTLEPVPVLFHTMKGYLDFCQELLPEFADEDGEELPDEERFNAVASMWKEYDQSFRRHYDMNAAKNEPNEHRPCPVPGYARLCPMLTPYQVEGVLNALNRCEIEWNTKEWGKGSQGPPPPTVRGYLDDEWSES